jgi:hypothetical protein
MKLGMRRRHEGRHLFVARLNELRAIAGTTERAHDAVDAIAGVAEDPLDAPLRQALYQEIADGVCHDKSSPVGPARVGGWGARESSTVREPAPTRPSTVARKAAASGHIGGAGPHHGAAGISSTRCAPADGSRQRLSFCK